MIKPEKKLSKQMSQTELLRSSKDYFESEKAEKYNDFANEILNDPEGFVSDADFLQGHIVVLGNFQCIFTPFFAFVFVRFSDFFKVEPDFIKNAFLGLMIIQFI